VQVENPAFDVTPSKYVTAIVTERGIARAPFTSIVFLFELSRNPNALLPLVVCCVISDGFVRLFSAESIMTGKLIKRGLIVLQDYSVPVLMRARIEQVMRKEFTTVKPEDDVKIVVRDVTPETTGVIPVIEKDGQLAGIVEARDFLKGVDSNLRVRDIARQDYVVARRGQSLRQVIGEMDAHNTENVVVVDRNRNTAPIGVARAADILRLSRWIAEEES
jgi:CBS domain-containing protein